MIADSLLVAGASNVIRLVGMHDTTTTPPVYPTYATVVGSILGESGSPLYGLDSLAMPYVAGTTGAATEYRADVPPDVLLPYGYVTVYVLATVDGFARPYSRRVLVVAP